MDGEERTPFSNHIQPSATAPNTPCQSSSSLAFTALPAELQLHILSFCSAPTLFQLMRVSSYLRKEASKLFWADSKTYFLIEARWLLEGGHAGFTGDDLDFLAHVQNVQVDDNQMLDFAICPKKNDGTIEVRQDGIVSFWNVLQKTCPRVKRVIINRAQGPRRGRNETHSVPQALQLVIRASPLGIATSAFVVERVDEHVDTSPSSIDAIYASFPRWQRALYQPRPDGLWEKTITRQDWKLVLAPAKPLSGPVGRFHELQYKSSRLELERIGLWLIMADFLYRHLSSNTSRLRYSCTEGPCNINFQTGGEWSLHSAVMHNIPSVYDDWTREGVYKWLSEEIQAEYEQRVTALKEKRDENYRRLSEIRDEWEQSSHEKQMEIRRLWAEQLENDPLWATGAKSLVENSLWKEFCCRFPCRGSERRMPWEKDCCNAVAVT